MADDKLRISINSGSIPGEEVVSLDGFLNAETAFRFRDAVRAQKPEILVIDMSGVRYVDSSGLGVLISLYVSYERNDKRFFLAGMNDRVWELFRTCKIQDVFIRYESVSQAEEAMRTFAERIAPS